MLSVNTTFVFGAVTQSGTGVYGSALKLRVALQVDGLIRAMLSVQGLPAQIVIDL
jgi:hypothetical protein